jgi:Prp8 binding protein
MCRDPRQRRAATTVAHAFPLTALTFGPTGATIVAGGVDNIIRVYDLRKEGETSLELRGHDDTITGLSLAPNGGDLLSNCMPPSPPVIITTSNNDDDNK